MQKITDPHEILGVSKSATDEEIKKEFKNLAKKYHPDICKLPDATDRFNEIQKAYNMIKNEESRNNMKENEELGDLLNEIENYEQLPTDDRDIIKKYLQKIKGEVTVVGRLLPTVVVSYEIGKIRKSRETYFASSIEKIPPYLAVAPFDFWVSEKDNRIILGIFNRAIKQDVVGKISYNKDNGTMEWLTIDERIVASASRTENIEKTFGYSQTFIVKSRGSVVGNFTSTNLYYLPLVSFTQFDAVSSRNKKVSVDSTKICFFGTRMFWTAEDNTVATAVREMVRKLNVQVCLFKTTTYFFYSFNLLEGYLI